MLLIYTKKSTPRLRYTLNVLFNWVVKTPFKLTDNKEEFVDFLGAKLNYSDEIMGEGVLQIHPHGLLFDRDIFEKEIYVSQHDGVPVFFQEAGQLSFVLPFDVFSAAFYLVSRFEEYLPFIPDEHGRFTPEQSIAYKHGFLEKPVVNIWTQRLMQSIQKKYPSLEWSAPEFKFISTIDVDNMYAYKGKGLVRIAAGFARDLSKFNFKETSQRFKTIFLRRRDPYDTLHYQLSLSRKYDFESIYFILFSAYGPFDKNLPMYSSAFQSAIKTINDEAQVGIHPSYQSNQSFSTLRHEIQSLRNVINAPVELSRQHFLKLQFPKTFRQLAELGIKHDYSMGYASHPGFRAGVCTPYPFYDLEVEEEIDLVIHPFCVMEYNLAEVWRLSPEEGLKKILEMMNWVKKYGGEFIPVWHNRTFSEKETAWKGWNTVYEKMVKEATA